MPARLARVVDAEYINAFRLGGPGADDVFVTPFLDISGVANAGELSRRLTLVGEAGNVRPGPFGIIEFDTPSFGLASPVFRQNPGFVQGGAREFILPNSDIDDLSNVTRKVIK
ncbi:MAG: hypothetical protein Tsb002_13770 [Wenzhouxiangellaceae bacterium]